MRCLPILLMVLAFVAVDSGAAADPDAWSIYLSARERAGGGEKPGGLVDYSYDIVSTIPSGKNEIEVRGAVVVMLPDLIRQELQTPQGPIQLFYDGARAWRVLGGQTSDLPQEAASLQGSELARRHVLFGDLPEKALVRYRRADEEGGRPVHVIEIIDVGGAPLRLYVDVETRDVVKQVYVGDVPGGGMAQVEETFSGFVDIDGIRFAARREVIRNGKSARRSTLSNFRVNSNLRREIVLH